LKIMKHSSKQRAVLYATRADFCRIFAEDMKNLYLLALVLTADGEKAEQCFVSGLDDCAAGNQVFKEWGRSWAHRVVIKNAIRMIAPGPARASRVSNPAFARGATAWTGDREQKVPVEVYALLGLPAFERFVFVMSVLEGYSDPDCALLLGCTRESLIQGRLRAFELIAGLDIRNALLGDTSLKKESLLDDRGSIQEPELRVLATPA
jgi:hypothetical protein